MLSALLGGSGGGRGRRRRGGPFGGDSDDDTNADPKGTFGTENRKFENNGFVVLDTEGSVRFKDGKVALMSTYKNMSIGAMVYKRQRYRIDQKDEDEFTFMWRVRQKQLEDEAKGESHALGFPVADGHYIVLFTPELDDMLRAHEEKRQARRKDTYERMSAAFETQRNRENERGLVKTNSDSE